MARDFASWSFTELRAGLSDGPVDTKPFASAVYTFGWVIVYAPARATLSRTIATTPSQCLRRSRQ